MSKLDLTKIKYSRFATANLKGMEFTYKKWLTLEEQRAFIDVVLDASMNNGEYSEVLKEYSIRTAVLTFYTDIDLMDVESPHEYIYGDFYHDVFDLMSDEIDMGVHYTMIREIDKKIAKYNSAVSVFIREMTQAMEGVNVQELMADMLNSIQNQEIMDMIKGGLNG